MKARDVMTDSPLSVAPHTSVGDVRRIMRTQGIRHLPVVSEDGLDGVVSARDIADADEHTQVSAYMTDDPVTVAPDAALSEVLSDLIGFHIGAVPVLDDGRVVGIISYEDLLRAMRGGPVGAGLVKVLVPLDMGDFSLDALAMASEMYRGAEIHAIHVLPGLSAAAPGTLLGDVDDTKRVENIRKAVGEQLAERDIPTPKLEVRVGTAASEITDYAEAIDADLIVIPSHARKGLERLVLGSVAEKVVKKAPCPVLVLRGKLPRLWHG